MPVVPTLQSDRVQQAGFPSARVSTNAPSFGLDTTTTPAVEKLDKQVQTFASEAMDEANKTAVLEQYTGMMNKKNAYLVEFSKLEGKSAMENLGAYKEKFEKDLQKTSEGLNNRHQEAMFQQAKAKMAIDYDEVLQKHSAQQYGVYQDNTFRASLESLQNDSVLNYPTNPGVVGRNQDQASELIAAYGARKGYGPDSDVVKNLSKNYSSKVHSDVMSQMLSNGQTPLAREYFAEVKDQMNKEDLVRTQAALREGTIRGESQTAATDIMLKHGNDMTTALSEARKIKDPDIQAATVHEIKQRRQEIEQAKELNEKALFEKAFNQIEQTKTRPDPTTFTRLSPEQKNAVDRRLEFLNKGIEPNTDKALYTDLMTMASTPALQEEFLQRRLLEDYANGKLSTQHFEEFTKLQKSVREKSAEGEGKLSAFRSTTTIVNDALLGIGVDPANKGKANSKVVKEFNYLAGEQIAQWEKDQNKKADEKTKADIVDQLLIKGVVKGSESSFFGIRILGTGTSKRAYELKPGEAIKVTDYDEIPQAELKIIESKLHQRGIPLSNRVVLDFYNDLLQVRAAGKSNAAQ